VSGSRTNVALAGARKRQASSRPEDTGNAGLDLEPR